MAANHRFDHSRFRVEPGQKVSLSDYDPGYTGGIKNKTEAKKSLVADVSRLAASQDLLWSAKEYSVIVIFQAMDAAGKDGAIRHVMSGVNPQGVSVHAFKAPNEEERLHHFLWRPTRVLPERGRIAIFNRSYYEEVLIVRVHPRFLDAQWLPPQVRKLQRSNPEAVWPIRYQAINEFEEVYSHQNVLFLKFFLHLSRAEQKVRFLQRLDEPEKNWKFSSADVTERKYWDQYMQAYSEMLSATSTKHAPWYIIPADKKWFTRACVADIVASRISELDLEPPRISEAERAAQAEARRTLEQESP